MLRWAGYMLVWFFSTLLTWKFKMKVSDFGGKWVTKNCQQQSVCLDTAEAAIPAAIPAAERCKALCITTAVTKVVSSLLCSTFLDYLHILKYLSCKIIYCIYAIKSLWLVNRFLLILIVRIYRCGLPAVFFSIDKSKLTSRIRLLLAITTTVNSKGTFS